MIQGGQGLRPRLSQKGRHGDALNKKTKRFRPPGFRVQIIIKPNPW